MDFWKLGRHRWSANRLVWASIVFEVPVVFSNHLFTKYHIEAPGDSTDSQKNTTKLVRVDMSLWSKIFLQHYNFQKLSDWTLLRCSYPAFPLFELLAEAVETFVRRMSKGFPGVHPLHWYDFPCSPKRMKALRRHQGLLPLRMHVHRFACPCTWKCTCACTCAFPCTLLEWFSP